MTQVYDVDASNWSLPITFSPTSVQLIYLFRKRRQARKVYGRRQNSSSPLTTHWSAKTSVLGFAVARGYGDREGSEDEGERGLSSLDCRGRGRSVIVGSHHAFVRVQSQCVVDVRGDDSGRHLRHGLPLRQSQYPHPDRPCPGFSLILSSFFFFWLRIVCLFSLVFFTFCWNMHHSGWSGSLASWFFSFMNCSCEFVEGCEWILRLGCFFL